MTKIEELYLIFTTPFCMMSDCRVKEMLVLSAAPATTTSLGLSLVLAAAVISLGSRQ